MSTPFVNIPSLKLSQLGKAPPPQDKLEEIDDDTSTGESDTTEEGVIATELPSSTIPQTTASIPRLATTVPPKQQATRDQCSVCIQNFTEVRIERQCERCKRQVCGLECSQKYLLKSLGATAPVTVCTPCLPGMKAEVSKFLSRGCTRYGDFTPSQRQAITSGATPCQSCRSPFDMIRSPYLCNECKDPVCYKCSFEFGDKRVAMTADRVVCNRCWPGTRRKLQMQAKMSQKENDLHQYNAIRAEVALGDRFLVESRGAAQNPGTKSPRVMAVESVAPTTSFKGKSCDHCKRSFSLWVNPSKCSRCDRVCCTAYTCTQVFPALSGTPTICRGCWGGAKKQLRYICKTGEAAVADAARAQLSSGTDHFEVIRAGACHDCGTVFDMGKHAHRSCSECKHEVCMSCSPMYVLESLGETVGRPICATCVSNIKQRIAGQKTPRAMGAHRTSGRPAAAAAGSSSSGKGKEDDDELMASSEDIPEQTAVPSTLVNFRLEGAVDWGTLPASWWARVAHFLRAKSVLRLSFVNAKLRSALTGWRRLRPFTLKSVPPQSTFGVIPAVAQHLSTTMGNFVVSLHYTGDSKVWRAYSTDPAVQQFYESEPLSDTHVPKYSLGTTVFGDGVQYIGVCGRSAADVGAATTYHVYRFQSADNKPSVAFERTIQVGGSKGVVEVMHRGALFSSFRSGNDFVVEAWSAASGTKTLEWKHEAASKSAKAMQLLVAGGELRLLAKDRPTETPFTLFTLDPDSLTLFSAIALKSIDYLARITIFGESVFYFDNKVGALKEVVLEPTRPRPGTTFPRLKLTRKQEVVLVEADSQYVLVAVNDSTVAVYSRVTGQRIRKFHFSTPVLGLRFIRDLALVYTPTNPKAATSALASPRNRRGSVVVTMNAPSELQANVYQLY